MRQYEGVEVNARDISNAEKEIYYMMYTGEQRPHMWWEEFELRLMAAFATIDEHKNRQLYTIMSKN